jgi:hypothetical protein
MDGDRGIHVKAPGPRSFARNSSHAVQGRNPSLSSSRLERQHNHRTAGFAQIGLTIVDASWGKIEEGDTVVPYYCVTLHSWQAPFLLKLGIGFECKS